VRGRLSEAAYFAHRAREEAHKALQADEPAVAAAHHGLSVRYMAQTCRLREMEAMIVPSAFPQLEDAEADILITQVPV
jgi:hypothetical protein